MRRRRLIWLVPALLIAAPAAAQKRIDPGSWFDPIDLSRALMAQVGTGGKLEMAVEVGADGLPLRCEIAVSSGIADLDALTCRLTMRRARWEPRRDAAGQGIAAATRVSVDWRLLVPPVTQVKLVPRAQRLLASRFTYQRMKLPSHGSVTLDIFLSADGRARYCRARDGGSSGSGEFDSWLCQRVLATKPLAVIDYHGAAQTHLRTTLHASWKIEPSREWYTTTFDIEPFD